MKRAWILGLAALVIGGSAAGYRLAGELSEQREVDAGLRKTTSDILEAYDAVTTDAAHLLAAAGATAVDADAAIGSDIPARVEAIRAQQRGLRAVLDLPADDPLRLDPAFARVERAMGERSDLRPSLQEYNDFAKRSNVARAGERGYLGRALSGDGPELPYLHFSGREAVTGDVRL